MAPFNLFSHFQTYKPRLLYYLCRYLLLNEEIRNKKILNRYEKISLRINFGCSYGVGCIMQTQTERLQAGL